MTQARSPRPSLRARLARRALVAGVRSVRRRSGGLPEPDDPIEDLEAYGLAARETLERLISRFPPPRGTDVRDVDAGVPATWVQDRRLGTTQRAVLHLHGGGYFMGSPRTHRNLAAAMSRASGAPVLLPEYRLMPEHTHPAALEDALTAYRWITGVHGVAPDRLAVTGDSAGGGLAVALLVTLRDAGEPLPACYAGMSPWTDLAGTGPSMDLLDEVDPWLPAALARRAATVYAGSAALDDPQVSPLYADLRGLPPMLVQVGGDEIVLDDARRLVERARAAGVDASVGVFPGLWHVFQAFPGFPESAAAVREIGAFARRHTSADRTGALPGGRPPHRDRPVAR